MAFESLKKMLNPNEEEEEYEEVTETIKTSSKEICSWAIKCPINKAMITNKDAPIASKIVMIITLLPTVLRTDALKEVPIEKAIKPNATVETQPILLTNW